MEVATSLTILTVHQCLAAASDWISLNTFGSSAKRATGDSTTCGRSLMNTVMFSDEHYNLHIIHVHNYIIHYVLKYLVVFLYYQMS